MPISDLHREENNANPNRDLKQCVFEKNDS